MVECRGIFTYNMSLIYNRYREAPTKAHQSPLPQIGEAKRIDGLGLSLSCTCKGPPFNPSTLQPLLVFSVNGETGCTAHVLVGS